MNDWLQTMLNGDVFNGGPQPVNVLLTMLLAFCLGHIAAWVYMWTHTGLSYSKVFTSSLIGIPVIVSLLMILMSGNIYIAFGLLAVFAVVRFRNVLKDTRDTTFILWVMVLGMAVGTQRYSTAVIGCIFVSIIFIYLRFVSFGVRHSYDVVLSLSYNGESDVISVLRPVLKRYSSRIDLASQRSDKTGAQELSYRLLLRDPSRTADILKDVLSTQGVSDASLYIRDDESEF